MGVLLMSARELQKIAFLVQEMWLHLPKNRKARRARRARKRQPPKPDSHVNNLLACVTSRNATNFGPGKVI